MFIDVTAVTSENIDLPPQDSAVLLELYLHRVQKTLYFDKIQYNNQKVAPESRVLLLKTL